MSTSCSERLGGRVAHFETAIVSVLKESFQEDLPLSLVRDAGLAGGVPELLKLHEHSSFSRVEYYELNDRES